MRNDEIAALLEEFADRLEATGVEYKPSAYRRAAENVREYPGAVEGLAAEGPEAVAEIDRVGDAIAAKIVAYVETGEIEELEQLRAELPADIGALTRVEGVGPKTVGTLYEELGVEDLDDLQQAAENEQIRTVKGFGAKTEQNIRENVQFAREADERTRLGDARPLAERLLAHLRESPAVERAETAGSIRRWRDTVGDVDVLVATTDGPAVVDRFQSWDAVDDVIEAGDQKASVRAAGVRVDIRAVDPDEFGAALQYFTGSMDHNVVVRNRAIDRGLKLNEYGVFDVSEVEDPDAGQRVGQRVAGATEADVYAAVDLPQFPPELREGTGEVDAADDGELPELVTVADVRGDLHTHTDWSDGTESIEEMVTAAAEAGYDYHCVTDHAAGPGVFGDIGLTDDEIRDQMEAVTEVAADAEIDVYHGVEANIDADGVVTTDEELLAALDLVVASPHAALQQGEATDRLIRAVEHPEVDILGHPTGRLINERPGLEVDFQQLAAAAADADTALEVNANPARLDLHGEAVRAAVEAGAPVAVDTDAHSPAEFDNVRYGVHTARRGWAEPDDVVNTWDDDRLQSFLG
ncbi:MAG: DNA polymerase/3'-5' exonuclease PolX [Halobaculum sp.]